MLAVGPTPPPTHGFSNVTRAIIERFTEFGVQVTHIQTSPMPGRRHAFSLPIRILRRSLQYLYAYVAFFRSCYYGGERVVYLALSAGLAQWLEIPFVILARLFSIQIYVHHHSFAYINRTKLSALTLMAIAGKSATHLLLGQTMARRFATLYPQGKILVLSNASFIDQVCGQSRTVSGKLCIGFLSNVSQEKGIREFLEVCKILSSSGVEFSALIGGPLDDELANREVLRACNEISQIRLLGPIYGSAKSQFFSDIDILVFPTRYINEAEPLVVLESLAAGVPCISTSRGEIKNLLSYGSSTWVLPASNFALDCVSLIGFLQKDIGLLELEKIRAKQRFEELVGISRGQFGALVSEISGVPMRLSIPGSHR